jgi:Divergent InlB B-repeat domain/WD40-like Beta Propeller Repeat
VDGDRSPRVPSRPQFGTEVPLASRLQRFADRTRPATEPPEPSSAPDRRPVPTGLRWLVVLVVLGMALLVPSVASAGIVTASVEGSGTLSATVQGISGAVVCPPDCERFVPDGTTIQVSAAPERGASFLGWGGACAAASGAVCTLTVAGDVSLSARFTVAPPPPPPVLERQRFPFLEDVTLAGSAPECTSGRFQSCDESLLGVLRDGRLLLLRTVVDENFSTVRAVGRTGLGAATIARVRAGRLDHYSSRLTTDRHALLWEELRSRRTLVGLTVPSGRRIVYPPSATAGVFADTDFDRAGGRLLVDAVLPGAGRREVLLVGRAGPGARRRIPTPHTSIGPRLSPDGRRVAYIVRGRVVVRSVRGGSLRTLTPASSAAADGRWFAGGVAPGARVRWSVESIAWSRDGRRIAAVVKFLGADFSAAIVSVRADGGDLRPLAVRSGAAGHVDWLPDGDVAFQAALARRDGSSAFVSAIGVVDAATGSVSYLRQPGVTAPE